MNTTTQSLAQHMLKIWEGPDADASESVAVLTCENCRQKCEKLYAVPEFEFMGCGRCFDEAIEVLEREAAELPVIARVPVGRAQGELFVEEVA